MRAALRQGIARSASCLQLAAGELYPLRSKLSSEASFSTLAAALRRRESREAETSSGSSAGRDRKREQLDLFLKQRATQHLLDLQKPAEFYPAARCVRSAPALLWRTRPRERRR